MLNMKKITHSFKITIVCAVLLLPVKYGFAQEQAIRAGSAGASELLINPFGRSSGWGAANVSSVTGLESQYSNVAGLASTEKTELIFTQTSWLQYGSKMFSATDAVSAISSFGFSQKVGESGVLGFAVMSMDFGY